MYDTATIRSTIVTLLSGITSGGNPIFANVYDFPNPNPAGYPCVIMDVVSDEGTFLDNITNLHVITFNIWVVQEITVKGNESAVEALDGSSKLAIQALEKLTNASLSGSISWSLPTMGARKQVQTTNGPVYYKELILKCNATASIN